MAATASTHDITTINMLMKCAGSLLLLMMHSYNSIGACEKHQNFNIVYLYHNKLLGAHNSSQSCTVYLKSQQRALLQSLLI